MNKQIKYFLIVSWILLTRSFDAYCTMKFTPNLDKESNPLVSIFGFTWVPLLITLGLLTLYVTYVYYLVIFKSFDLQPKEKGFSFSEFMTFTYLGRKGSWTAMLYKFPKDLNRFNHWMGSNLTSCIVYAGFVSTIMWLLIYSSEFYKDIHSATLIYSILVIGSVLLIYNWNRRQFVKYKEG